VTTFTSVFPHLTRIDDTIPLSGRTIDRVEARGKHLLIWFSGDLVLRTHMRMHGSWHIYRPGERWQRPRHEMRIVIETDAFQAVAFMVPVAELAASAALERNSPLREIGPDLLSADFDSDEAFSRLRARTGLDIADALLDQSAIAGIGNVYKSETLFASRVNPFTRVVSLSADTVERVVTIAVKLMRANIGASASGGIVTYSGLRRTTGRADPSARLWVYGRAGKPCRRCGALIQRRKQGPHARSTYWCERCQTSNYYAQIPKPKSQNPNPNGEIPEPKAQSASPKSQSPSPDGQIATPEVLDPHPKER
jgi:endonuclease-8